MRTVTRHLLDRFGRAALAATLAFGLAAPGASFAGDTTGTADPPLLAQEVAPKDAYESDDSPASARVLLRPDVWAGMSRFATAPLTQSRTFHVADDARPDGADQDWFRFTVDATAVRTGMSVLIEAVSEDPSVDPVIEVYGPFAAGVLPVPTPVSGLAPAAGGGIASDPAATAAFDDDPWFASRGAAAAIVLDPAGGGAGTYFVRVRPYWGGAAGGFAGGAGAYTLRAKAGLASRLEGEDRYATSVRVSRERYAAGEIDGGGCVIASGTGFADALAGATLAGAVRGPLLLTDPRYLPSPVAAEVRRLGVSTVYVLGSTKAVSSAVASKLDALPGVSVVRVAGRDRYETAVRVAERSRALLEARGDTLPSCAFVASGGSFPDALSAAPMAAYNAAPVLLTPPRRPDPAMLSALSRLGVTDVVLVGGRPAVDLTVQRALERALGGSGHVLRVAGPDRYQTSRALARWATAGGADMRVGTPASPAALRALQPASVGLASGVAFPDALTGGVLCGMRGAPVLLTGRYKLSGGVLGYVDNLGQPTFLKSYAFGSASAVAQGTMDHFDLLTTAWWGSQ